MKSDAYIKIGNLAFHGFNAEVVGVLIVMAIFGIGMLAGYMLRSWA